MIDALAADRAHIVDFDAQIYDLEHTPAGPVLDTSTIQVLKHTPSLAMLQSQRALAQGRLDSYKYPV
jgi:hypothetical protein